MTVWWETDQIRGKFYFLFLVKEMFKPMKKENNKPPSPSTNINIWPILGKMVFTDLLCFFGSLSISLVSIVKSVLIP